MSFRELRNFTEIMRALGYPRLVSVDNFRKPHFALVADILYWMATRYDPNAHIPDDIDTENERVLFVTKVAELFAAKAGIKLKTRRLYAADGKAECHPHWLHGIPKEMHSRGCRATATAFG